MKFSSNLQQTYKRKGQKMRRKNDKEKSFVKELQLKKVII